MQQFTCPFSVQMDGHSKSKFHAQTKNQVNKQSCEVERGFKSRKVFKRQRKLTEMIQNIDILRDKSLCATKYKNLSLLI